MKGTVSILINTFFAIGAAIIFGFYLLTEITNSMTELVITADKLLRAIAELIEVIKKLIAKK
ncbi:hypothetical protein [Lactobacillus sp. ESL0681]|uniref:hypothetical protein n=1 Tax=Lactobacillus sp. ESL0681 TaxID=2983211 RepID=UPI0023F827AB|nr:hypothetical protein [Lactobacillus sp. ESL0681]WEV40078.1 hypothetical protein OZX59_07675 [Lactobacillus sp. ESL0681]